MIFFYQRSNDRSGMSKQLTEEAEKYIEDFLSSVEDADISSLDGERSDTSSSIGVLIKPESFHSPLVARSVPNEMDGVVLPWLQWETNSDASATSQNKTDMLVTPTTANSVQVIIDTVLRLFVFTIFILFMYKRLTEITLCIHCI